MQHLEKIATLIDLLPNIQRYVGKTVVIKYGGSAMVDKTARMHFIQDLVLLKTLGIRPLVIHGGGAEITQMLDKLGKESPFITGHRVTDQETMEVVEMVLSGKLNKGIVADIHQQGGRAIGLSGKDDRLLLVEKKYLEQHNEKLDIGFVGQVRRVNPTVLDLCLDNQLIPIISSIGVDEQGQSYNINADDAAGAIACALKADYMIFLTDVNGIMLDPNEESTLLSTVTKQEVEQLILQGIIQGGMLPKVKNCLAILDSGVQNVTILNGKLSHALLLHLFSDECTGTLITQGDGV